MRPTWLGKGAFIALIVGVTGSSGVMAGCAEERDPINRVQSGALPKSFFLGADLEDFKDDPEFRTKSYNIDSAANTENFAGTIGGATAVDRIRWEVTEDMLLARRSYQESPGADNRGVPRKQDPKTGKWVKTITVPLLAYIEGADGTATNDPQDSKPYGKVTLTITKNPDDAPPPAAPAAAPAGKA